MRLIDDRLDALHYTESMLKGRTVEEDENGYVTCANCGEKFFYHSSLYNGVCCDCLKKLATPERAMKLGANDEQSMKLNGYLVQTFEKEEIEKILLAALKGSGSKEHIGYCIFDPDEFAKVLENEGVL